jgi:hypothetical protein
MPQRALSVVVPETVPFAAGKFGIRPIATFPEFVAASARMDALTVIRDAAADELDRFSKALRDQKIAEHEFRSSLEFRMQGAHRSELPEPPFHESDRAPLQRDLDAAQEDLMRHKEVLDEIEGRCTLEILEAVRPRHRQMMTRVLNAVAELSNALDEETEFREALAAEHVSAGFPTIPFPIRTAIGLKQYEWSGVSQTMKWLAPYVLPATKASA